MKKGPVNSCTLTREQVVFEWVGEWHLTATASPRTYTNPSASYKSRVQSCFPSRGVKQTLNRSYLLISLTEVAISKTSTMKRVKGFIHYEQTVNPRTSTVAKLNT